MLMEVKYKLFRVNKNTGSKEMIGEYAVLNELKRTIRSLVETHQADLEQLYVIRHRYITDETKAEWYVKEMGNGYNA
jgi:hypothetical protein